ncbi:MAG TPA: extracellular solute-binding protein [Candidatus Eisenbergiella pullistercoris]|uniref:Extracellular solute-binding protein n=1 Tax=Candidatus Eisenbergiella pullistercoris TaxID=2838555 RepID=A0A9D1YQ23_9FIRM|nr:extracellular solute-binding protein [Candidatus Eisenbergiella pullistercoris]
MKKKSLQKALALAVAAVMSLGTLAGCGSSETTTESAAPAETTAESAAETTADAETEAASTEAAAAEGGGMDSWEPFAENVTLQVPVYDRGVEGVPDVTNNYWTQWIQENFGDQYNVTVEFVPITRNDVMTDYALLASAGTLPTMLMEFDYPKLAQWANEGYLSTFDMNEFASVAPTYYNRMVELNQLQYSTMDGETYFVFAERPYSDTGYSWQVFVRMDWLEEVGYDHVPTTREEYLDAMQKIMDAGICEHPGGGSMLTGLGSDQNDGFRTMPFDEKEWAVYGDYNIVAMSWEPNKKLVQYANEEYNLGITNPEYYVTDNETAKANFVNGGQYSFGGYISGNVDFLTAFYENNPDGKLAIQPANYVYAETSAYRADNPFGMMVGFASSATEDQIKAAWMYLEWMSQEDVLFTLQWGVEGENYTMGEDGNPVSVGDYDGDYKQGYNNNADYVAPVIASRVLGDPEADIRASFPTDLPQTEELVAQILEFYNTRAEQAAEGLAIVPCMYATVIDAESEYRDTLGSLYTQYRDELTMCAPEEFDALYDQRAQEYLDAGYQAIIDERAEAYDAGLTTKLAQ